MVVEVLMNQFRVFQPMMLVDLSEDGQRFLAAKGGYGGRGNARFATSTEAARSFAARWAVERV